MLADVVKTTNNLIATLTLNFLKASGIKKCNPLSFNLYIESLIENLKKIVWNSFLITTLIVGAASIIYSIHTANEFSIRGLNVYYGGIIALALIRECVPVMAALAIVTYYCTGMTAQIGSMKVTEQLDAMKIAKVEPALYLLAPMLVSAIIGFPILIIVSIFIGLLVSYLSSNLITGITSTLFINSILNVIEIKDIVLALVKASAFGFIVTLISYTCGAMTTGGAKDVGESIKISVVLNFVMIVILDYLITALWL